MIADLSKVRLSKCFQSIVRIEIGVIQPKLDKVMGDFRAYSCPLAPHLIHCSETLDNAVFSGTSITALWFVPQF